MIALLWLSRWRRMKQVLERIDATPGCKHLGRMQGSRLDVY